LIKYIADVLAWHAVLFEVIEPGAKRLDFSVTNEEVIAKLPLSRQAEARQTLARFCQAFNAALPEYVEQFFECKKNPYLNYGTDPYSVDLTGTGKGHCPMDIGTSASFGLPAEGMKDGTGLQGLCTIRVCREFYLLRLLSCCSHYYYFSYLSVLL
jgi:hypothetical protein